MSDDHRYQVGRLPDGSVQLSIIRPDSFPGLPIISEMPPAVAIKLAAALLDSAVPDISVNRVAPEQEAPDA